jgi:hypothetical protein
MLALRSFRKQVKISDDFSFCVALLHFWIKMCFLSTAIYLSVIFDGQFASNL